MKAATSAAPASMGSSRVTLTEPCVETSLRPKTTSATPGESSSSPRQSSRSGPPAWRPSARAEGSSRAASTSPTMPIGRLTKKIQRHDRCVTSTPPRTGPSTGPSSIGTPTTLMTRPMRCGPAAWARVIIPIGMIIPPASPCRTRKAMSDSALQAKPHSALVATKAATIVIHTRRGPKRSAAQPVSGITVASASR